MGAVQLGYPAQVLLDLSNGAPMLVVGSRGHDVLASLLLGSVNAACTEHRQSIAGSRTATE